MIYVAIDPGRTSGVCILEHSDAKHLVHQSYEIGWDERFNRLEEIMEQWAKYHPVMIVEQFLLFDTVKALKSNDMPSSQMIGIIQTTMFYHNQPPDKVVFLSPNVKSNRNLLLEDLKKIKPSSEHCLDAYKLVVYHLTKVEFWAPQRDLCYNEGELNRVPKRRK